MKTLQTLKVTFIALSPLVAFGLIGAFTSAPAGASGVSQITLSCSSPPPESNDTNGCTSTGPVFAARTGTLDFFGGFWIWCQSPTQGTPYGPDCSGSTYIEEVHTATGSGVYQTTSISGTSSTGGKTGLQVTFTTSDSDMTCTLDVPTSPTHGASNTVAATCDRQGITFGNVVVGT